MIKGFGLISVVMLAGSPALAEDTSWHLLTQTGKGTVSLIKNLSQHECEFARARALGLPATDEEKKQAEEATHRELIEKQRYLWEHRKECVRLGPDRTSCPSGPFSQVTIDDKGQTVGGITLDSVVSFTSENSIMSAECFQ